MLECAAAQARRYASLNRSRRHAKPRRNEPESLHVPARQRAITIKTILQTLLLLFVLSGPAHANWIQYQPPDQSFDVSVPGTPEVETNELTSLAFGVITANSATYVRGQQAFSVSWMDYPKGSYDNADIDASLDQGRDGCVQGVQGTLLGEERISLDNYPGRYIRISTAGDRMTVLVRMYQVQDRVYVLQVVTPKEDAFSPDIGRFFDSFNLVSTK